jgi:dUTPase
MKQHCKFRPEHDDVTHGINLKIQENEILEPNEFKKVDLGIKIFSNRCRPVHLTPILTTCLKYSVQILTGLVDIGFSSYLQIGIFNCTNETIRIPKCTEMCEIHCLEHPIKVIDEYESETIDHGGELEPNTLYIDRLWRFAEGNKEVFKKTKERLDKYPVEGPLEVE